MKISPIVVMSENFYKPLTLVLFTAIFFQSCEKFTLPTDVEKAVPDQNKTLTIDEVGTPIPASTKPIKVANTVEQEKEPVVIQQPVLQEDKTPTIIPEKPKYSDELLKAVQNWTRIPKSVFLPDPFYPRYLSILLTSSVELLPTLSPAGSELQVLGMKGNTLIVANANNSKLRGEVNIDQTDFKQLLAYRFELNKEKGLN